MLVVEVLMSVDTEEQPLDRSEGGGEWGVGTLIGTDLWFSCMKSQGLGLLSTVSRNPLTSLIGIGRLDGGSIGGFHPLSRDLWVRRTLGHP